MKRDETIYERMAAEMMNTPKYRAAVKYFKDQEAAHTHEARPCTHCNVIERCRCRIKLGEEVDTTPILCTMCKAKK